MIKDLNFFDAKDDSKKIFDVCIIGAGAAGITAAIEVSKYGAQVALCEAGGDEYSDESQDSYKGNVEGDPYFDLDIARLRFLGGTTNHWGGWCRSFDKIDFNRGYLGKEYEWPIDIDELSIYRKKACDILDVDDDFEKSTDQINRDIKKIKFQISEMNFLDKYKKILEKSKNIRLFLNSNLIALEGNQDIKSAKFISYNNSHLTINAKRYIFAMGGIENSRYLLWFAKKYGNKFFDTSTPIGKYWMEHPHFNLGKAIVKTSVSDNYFYSLTPEAQINSKILNCGLMLEKQYLNETKSMIRDLACVAPVLAEKLAKMLNERLVCGVIFRSAWEQSPTLSNAVTLNNSFDKFGIPRVSLKWKKNILDRKTINKSVQLFNNWIMEENLGRIQLQEWMTKDFYPTDGHHEFAGYHHMGGTRMSNSKQFGVVDGDCKVYGSKNLYIAGSSIFTTGGHNNPTLPIVQFALRLANHINNL